jgi:hypothetical protein
LTVGDAFQARRVNADHRCRLAQQRAGCGAALFEMTLAAAVGHTHDEHAAAGVGDNI